MEWILFIVVTAGLKGGGVHSNQIVFRTEEECLEAKKQLTLSDLNITEVICLKRGNKN